MQSMWASIALAVVSLAVSACSGDGAPSAAPSSMASSPPSAASATTSSAATSSATASQSASAAVPTPAATASASTAPSSTASAGGLDGILPTEVAGVPFATVVLTPDDVAQQDPSQRYTALAESLGRPLDEFVIAQGSGGISMTENVALEAFRLPGADTAALRQAQVDRLLEILVEGTQTTEATIGGKQVIQVGEQDPSFPRLARYVYAVGDTVFVVFGPSDELNEALLSVLP